MKTAKTTIFAALAVALTVSCSCGKESSGDGRQDGIVLNEFVIGADGGWVEVVNTSSSAVNTKGLKICLSDDYWYRKPVHDFGKGKLGPGERMSVKISREDVDVEKLEELVLTGADGNELDCYGVAAESDLIDVMPDGSSLERCPEGTGEWRIEYVPTPGEPAASLTPSNRNAIWMWARYMKEVDLDELAAKHIGNIVMHEVAFSNNHVPEVIDFMARAARKGITVHVWMQCFYNNGKWISPVIDSEKRYDTELFESIALKGEKYVRYGAGGVHLDYIRFGGTAGRHNINEEVNSVGAVTTMCRIINERLKALNPDVVLSAALMPEPGSEAYYGQNPEQMGEYMDVLMPMIYRYNEGGSRHSASWAQNVAKFFAEHGAPAECWAGTTTYSYNGNNPAGLPVDDLKSDCMDFENTGATGLVLFRYGLGSIPDLGGIWTDKKYGTDE